MHDLYQDISKMAVGKSAVSDKIRSFIVFAQLLRPG